MSDERGRKRPEVGLLQHRIDDNGGWSHNKLPQIMYKGFYKRGQGERSRDRSPGCSGLSGYAAVKKNSVKKTEVIVGKFLDLLK